MPRLAGFSGQYKRSLIEEQDVTIRRLGQTEAQRFPDLGGSAQREISLRTKDHRYTESLPIFFKRFELDWKGAQVPSHRFKAGSDEILLQTPFGPKPGR